MAELLVVYDSKTGNTEKMAKAVAEGAKSVPSIEIVLRYYVRPKELEEASAIIFGSPTYHHDTTLPIKHILELPKNKFGHENHRLRANNIVCFRQQQAGMMSKPG